MKRSYTKRIKVISIILSLIMVLSVSACDTSTQDTESNYKKDRNIVNSGFCAYNSDNVTWTLYDDGELVISGTGAMPDYVNRNDAPWHRQHYNSIKSVTIGNDITAIGVHAFSCCFNLSSVIIGNDVLTIGAHSFEGTELSEITIPDNVTKIDFYAFNECENLTTVKLGKDVTSIGDHAFSFCNSLVSVTIPENVTSIGNEAFNNCKNLTSIIVDEDNSFYSNDENGVLFNKNKSELILYPKGKKENSYTIPHSVTKVGENAFAWSESITNMTIPDSVTSIEDWAFDGCTNLNSITISKSVTNIEDYAFLNCSNLYTIYYTGTEDQWKDITIGICNDKLKNATILYNS